jgi:hypothetical protein
LKVRATTMTQKLAALARAGAAVAIAAKFNERGLSAECCQLTMSKRNRMLFKKGHITFFR